MRKPRICPRCEREFYTPEDVEGLKARLEAAEAERDVMADSLAACSDALQAEEDASDKARADAERLAEVLRSVVIHLRGDPRRLVEDALAAHEPHLTDEVPEEFQAHTQLGLPASLTGPKHKPTGTFYTTEDAQGSGAGDSLRESGAVTPGSFPPSAPEERLTWRGLAEQLAGSLTLVLADALGEDDRAEAETALAVFDALSVAPDDVGPPAPGEGEPEDGYPNPEVGMEC